MKHILLITMLGLLLLGCKTTTPDVDLSQYENTHLCKHKYSDEFDFYYKGQIRANQKELFGEMIFIFTYTLLDDTKRYLTKDEVSNYRCQRAS